MKKKSEVEAPTVAEFSYQKRLTISDEISKEVAKLINAAKIQLNKIKQQHIELNATRNFFPQKIVTFPPNFF